MVDPYEWFIHYPLALKEGASAAVLAQVREGKRPVSAKEDEAAAYDFAVELLRHRVVECSAGLGHHRQRA